jgi:hypothetical protein
MTIKLFLLSAVAGCSLVAAAPLFSGDDDLHTLHAHLAKLFGHEPHAHGAETPGGHDVAAHLDAAVERLGLTIDQRRHVAGVLAGHLPAVRAGVEVLMRAHHRQLAQLHRAFDEQAIREASAPVGAAQAELAVLAGRLLDALHATLTAEQLQAAQALHHGLAGDPGRRLAGICEALEGWIERNR